MSRFVVAAMAAAVLVGGLAPAGAANKGKLKDGLLDGMVIVYADKEALRKARTLFETGVAQKRPEMMLELIKCVAEPGTEAVMTDFGWTGTVEVMVTSGPNAGCEGVIYMEEWDG